MICVMVLDSQMVMDTESNITFDPEMTCQNAMELSVQWTNEQNVRWYRLLCPRKSDSTHSSLNTWLDIYVVVQEQS